MEKLLGKNWISLFSGQLSFLYSCCKRPKADSDECSTEEREPFVPVHDYHTDNGSIHASPDIPNNKCNRKNQHASSSGRGNVVRGPTVDFWIPEIRSVQPEQEEYFKQTHEVTSVDSTPTTRRRNTLPSSVCFKSATSSKDCTLTASDLKPDLYHTTDWGGSLSSECAKQSSADGLLGELVYSLVAEDNSKDKRVKLKLNCVRNLPELANDAELRCVVRSHGDSRHIETVESSVEKSCLVINKTISISSGMAVEVILLDFTCQDVFLAHGTVTLNLNQPRKDEKSDSKTEEKTERLTRSLKSRAGAELMIGLEHDLQNQNLFVNISKISITNMERFCDKYVYVKATLYYRYKKIKSNKTPAILLRKTCLNYAINKRFAFVISSTNFDELILVVNLMERSLLRQDILLGREIFGPFLKSFDGADTLWGRINSTDYTINYKCQM